MLETRDRALALVSDIPTVNKLERRGTTARNQLERDVRKARTRLERELRGRRRDAEKLVAGRRRDAEKLVKSQPRARRVARRDREGARLHDRLARPPHFPRPADGERRGRVRFAGLISRRRMQYLSSLNRRRAFGHGGGV